MPPLPPRESKPCGVGETRPRPDPTGHQRKHRFRRSHGRVLVVSVPGIPLHDVCSPACRFRRGDRKHPPAPFANRAGGYVKILCTPLRGVALSGDGCPVGPSSGPRSGRNRR